MAYRNVADDRDVAACDLVFITLTEYAARRGVSLATVKREIRQGNGPKITQLSPKRIGIRLDHYREDCDRRVREQTARQKAKVKPKTGPPENSHEAPS